MTTHPTRYDDTTYGRASEWVRGFVPGQVERPTDFHGAVEALGIEKAKRTMRKERQG